MAIKLADIAEIAQVSTATVSYVLNGKSRSQGISEATARRIRKVAADHGYVSNLNARFLRQGRYNLIALISPHCADFYADLLRGIEQEGDQHEFQVLFGSTFNSTEREENYVRHLLSRRIDGAIVLPIDIHNEYLRLFVQNQVPTVYFRRRADSDLCTKFMTFDDQEGARISTTHLIEQGCERLAFCSPVAFMDFDHDVIVHEARLAGYAQALEEHGRAYSDDQLWMIDDQDPDYARDFLARVRAQRIDGLVCLSDRVGVPLLRFLQASGLRVPEDVKVVGFDDSDFARLSSPTLSSIALPKVALGTAMVEAIVRMSEKGEQETDEVLLTPKLVVRESSATSVTSEWLTGGARASADSAG